MLGAAVEHFSDTVTRLIYSTVRHAQRVNASNTCHKFCSVHLARCWPLEMLNKGVAFKRGTLEQKHLGGNFKSSGKGNKKREEKSFDTRQGQWSGLRSQDAFHSRGIKNFSPRQHTYHYLLGIKRRRNIPISIVCCAS